MNKKVKTCDNCNKISLQYSSVDIKKDDVTINLFFCSKMCNYRYTYKIFIKRYYYATNKNIINEKKKEDKKDEIKPLLNNKFMLN